MRAVGVQPLMNRGQHRISLRQHLSVVEAQHGEAGLLQNRGAPGIGGRDFGLEVLPTIEFDDQQRFEAREVCEKRTDRVLAAELEARGHKQMYWVAEESQGR